MSASFEHESILDATDYAIANAEASGHLTALDAGAVATLRHLAMQIDAQEEGLTPSGKLDNVSVPTYLKYLNDLGLTPAARAKLTSLLDKADSGKGDAKLGKFNVFDKKSA